MPKNYNKVYITKQQFDNLCRIKQTYEGFVIGVGYAFVNYCFWKKGKLYSINPRYIDHTTHFPFFVKIQMLDLSPEALNKSYGECKGVWIKSKATGKYRFSADEQVPKGDENMGPHFILKDEKGRERSFNVNGSISVPMHTYIEYTHGIFETSWITLASKELGVKEEGKKGIHNPRIIEYHHATSGKFNDDETPWCSSFVNWVMKECNIERTNNALAISWKKWGQDLGKVPAYGSIGVLKFPNGGRHVGFVVGRSRSGKLILLGGNQSNKVKLSVISEHLFEKFVYPNNFIPSYDLPMLEESDTLNYNSTR